MFYTCQDIQSNVIGLLLGNSQQQFAGHLPGDLIERYTYDPYGSQDVYKPEDVSDTLCTILKHYTYRLQDPSGVYTTVSICPVSFQGLFLDEETGLYNNRARIYAPRQGRFLQRDPLGYPDGMNSYAAYHVMQQGVDPSGLRSSLKGMLRTLRTKLMECAGKCPTLLNWQGGITWIDKHIFGNRPYNNADLISDLSFDAARAVQRAQDHLSSVQSVLDLTKNLQEGFDWKDAGIPVDEKILYWEGERSLNNDQAIKLKQIRNAYSKWQGRLGKAQKTLQAISVASEYYATDPSNGRAMQIYADWIDFATSIGQDVPGIGEYLGFVSEATGSIADAMIEFENDLTEADFRELAPEEISCGGISDWAHDVPSGRAPVMRGHALVREFKQALMQCRIGKIRCIKPI